MNYDTFFKKKRGVIFDLDGTIANNTHRQHFLEDTPKNWEAFFASQKDDLPNNYVADLVRKHHEDWFYDVIILSSRPEDYRTTTVDWLEDNEIPYKELILRPVGNRTDDHILKVDQYFELIEPFYEVQAVYEDRPRICRAFREIGLTVLQLTHEEF